MYVYWGYNYNDTATMYQSSYVWLCCGLWGWRGLWVMRVIRSIRGST